MHSNEVNTKIMLYSGAKDTELSNQVEKMKKIEKKFLTFLPPRGTPTPAPYLGFGATYQKSPRWPHD